MLFLYIVSPVHYSFDVLFTFGVQILDSFETVKAKTDAFTITQNAHSFFKYPHVKSYETVLYLRLVLIYNKKTFSRCYSY